MPSYKTPEEKAAYLAREREKSRLARARRTPEQIEAQKQRCRVWYLRNKEHANAANSAWGKVNRHKHREYYLTWERRHPLRAMYQRSKSNAKQRKLEFTLTLEDLTWPTHCPILGIELVYERDKKEPHRDNYPTIDRWDNSKGYVSGNVFVISWRANRMKWHSTVEELEAIVQYMRERPSLVGVSVSKQILRFSL